MNIGFKNFFKYNRPLIFFLFFEGISILLTSFPNLVNKKPFYLLQELIIILNKHILYIKDYSKLESENELLIKKNLELQTKLLNLKQEDSNPTFNLIINSDDQISLEKIVDTKEQNSIQNKNKFTLISARITNNSITNTNNYITINKGEKDGIEPNMGVISINGIVGKTKYVSKHISTIISVLHTKNLISVKFKNSNTFGTLTWDGKDSKKALILYVPKYADIKIGEKVITSGYNSIFPEGILVGKVTKVEKKKYKLFPKIIIEFNIDYASLKNVYIVKNNELNEIIDLEQKTKDFYE